MTTHARTAQDCQRDALAIVDIGSNSVRLVVYNGAKRAPTPLFNEKVSCGLGRGLAETGRLSDKSVARALAALTRFRAIADQLGAKAFHVIATAAAREAENGPEFLARAEDICRASIDLLSGKREAELAACGIIAGIHEPDGLAGDLGGGSLELINISDRQLVGGVTLPLGGLRLIDVSGGDMAKARAFVAEQLDKVPWLQAGEGRPFYAVGGTWRAFARLHMAQTRYPLRVMHGYAMSRDDTLKFAHLLDHLSPQSLEEFDQFSRARQETIPYGALVLESLVQRMRPSEIVFSAFGVREGLLYSLLDEDEKARDPLLAACEELADLQARCPEHARELCVWTDSLFRPPGPEETAEERRLRHAACLLSDIGWRAHPDYRGAQTLNLIAHGAFAGIDHAGRAFLALTVFFRHVGSAEAPDERLRDLVTPRMLERARILGEAIRVIHMVSAAMPGIVDKTPIAFEKKQLVLTLPAEYAVLDGERLQKRMKQLARLLDVKPVIRIAPAS